MKPIKIGVVRETKIPPDHRVALPPAKIIELKQQLPHVEVVVQPSPMRCFSDAEYLELGISMQEDLSDCDILIGVKEVDIPTLITDKTYLFFAHVAKEQPYNRILILALLEKGIRMVDYEYLTDSYGVRLIAFGRWAGIVGAYNGLRGLGIHSNEYSLKPAHTCHDRQEMDAQLSKVELRNTRILLSGGGRVAQGAMETLGHLGIREVNPEEYSNNEFAEPVFCRIDPWHYVARRDGQQPFDQEHFFDYPEFYLSTSLKYLRKTDLYIAAHYWNPDSPRMFELDDLKSGVGAKKTMPIKVIADISCDINGSVPSTLRATTIAEPYYWFDPETGKELARGEASRHILMMTVDNLPGELPRDASQEFSNVLVSQIIPRLTGDDPENVIKRASITEAGELTEDYNYLDNYVKGR